MKFRNWFGVLCLLTATAFGQNPQTQTAPIFAANSKYVNGVAPGYMPCGSGAVSCPSVTGLNFHIGPGTANCGGTMVTYAGGTFTLTASTVNYIYLNTGASCVPAVKTTTYTSSDIPIVMVTTGSSTVTGIVDDRTIFNLPGSGSGIPCLTGDVTAGSGGSCTSAVLSTVNSSPGSCGDSTHVCQVTTNGKGLVTGQTQVAISAGGSTVTATSPYLNINGSPFDSSLQPAVKISGTTLTNIDLPADLVDGAGNSNYTSADATGIVHGQYPGIVSTNGDWVLAGGYNNEVQTHWMENVSGKTSAALSASIENASFGTHVANIGTMICDTVNHVMAEVLIFGNGGSPPTIYIVVWQSNWNIISLGYTECAANYPISGFWNQNGNPPVIVAAQFSSQYIDPSHIHLKWVYYPTAIPGTAPGTGGEWNGGTIPGPGWAYWYSNNGTQWNELGNICASGCVVSQAVGAPTQFGIGYYSGNRTGWYGASIADIFGFDVEP